jgi:hypothetical protein
MDFLRDRVWLSTSLIFYLLLVVMLIAIFVNFVLRILPMGLPWRTFLSSFFVRLSFTQMPMTTQQVEFRDLALGLSFLNHSETYRHPEALNMMTKWLAEVSAFHRNIEKKAD